MELPHHPGPPSNYIPSEESIKLIAFIRASGIEDNANAEIHYRLGDKYFGKDKQVLIESFRGSAKSTMMEWFIIYAAVNGKIYNFGKVDFIAFIGDSAENGVKNFFRNVAGKIDRSEFLQQFIKIQRKTDSEMELVNKEGHQLNIKGYGMKALSLETELLTDNGTITIGECKPGDVIFGPDGKPTKILHKSEVFDKPMYRLQLRDGRYLDVSDDHINCIIRKINVNNRAAYEDLEIETHELVKLPLQHIRDRKTYTSSEDLLFVRNNDVVAYSEKEFPLDPYTLGVLLGDGSLQQSVRLHCDVKDLPEYMNTIPYEFGKIYVDNRNTNCISVGIKGLQKIVFDLGLQVHGDYKKIPYMYMRGSINQRRELLKGLMDTDGTISKNGRTVFYSNSEELAVNVASLVRSLGGTAKIGRNRKAYKVEIWLYGIFKLQRKVSRESIKREKPLVAIESIKRIEAKPSQCIAVDNESHQFLAGDYVRTHNTNIRGVRYNGVRPDVIVLDDVTTNEALTSEVIQNTINDNFYKAIIPALHPTRYRIYVIGTPISERDLLHQLSQNSKWVVHKFPICEKFPCSKEEFVGNWEDRFPYEAVLEKYEMYKDAGKLQDFYQEYMLEITDLSTLLVDESDIRWFDPSVVYKNKTSYNIYIATDFATSTKRSADFSTIGVIAINNNNDWMLIDGQAKRQTMKENIDDLFAYVRKYNPLSVGIESSGQQGGFISILEDEMLRRNTWFSFAKKPGSKEPGIRPLNDKVHRFVTGVQPKFKQNKVWLPKPELLESKNIRFLELVNELLHELGKFTLAGGVKALKHDDAIDLFNQFSEMEKYVPSAEAEFDVNSFEYDQKGSSNIWSDFDDESEVFGGSTIF